jgi:hypothetical protein
MSMENPVKVSFQIVMGQANPGPVRTGSLAELYAHFFDIARAYIPPLAPLNDKLATGLDRAGEHGIHIRWTPLQINQAMYVHFCQELLNSTVRKYEQVTAPAEVCLWDDWSWWIYATQIHPKLPIHPTGSPSCEELVLRRRYRKAVAAGDASTAEALVSEIRERYDASFT